MGLLLIGSVCLVRLACKFWIDRLFHSLLFFSHMAQSARTNSSVPSYFSQSIDAVLQVMLLFPWKTTRADPVPSGHPSEHPQVLAEHRWIWYLCAWSDAALLSLKPWLDSCTIGRSFAVRQWDRRPFGWEGGRILCRCAKWLPWCYAFVGLVWSRSTLIWLWKWAWMFLWWRKDRPIWCGRMWRWRDALLLRWGACRALVRDVEFCCVVEKTRQWSGPWYHGILQWMPPKLLMQYTPRATIGQPGTDFQNLAGYSKVVTPARWCLSRRVVHKLGRLRKLLGNSGPQAPWPLYRGRFLASVCPMRHGPRKAWYKSNRESLGDLDGQRTLWWNLAAQ